MHLQVIAGAACALVVLFTLAVSAYRLLFSPLQDIPGPFLARFTNAWYFWRVSRWRYEKDNIELHRKHGDIVRYGPHRYSFSNSDAMKPIYGFGSPFPKSSWYDAASPIGRWTLFADRSIPRHTENRKMFQSTYSLSSLVTFENYVDECADLFSQRLSEIAHASLPINFAHWLTCYAFDVIAMITYGKRLGFLDKGDDIGGVMAALEDNLKYFTLCGIYPFWHPYITKLRNYFAGGMGVGRAYVGNFTVERIGEHKANPKAVPLEGDEEGKSVDFLTKFFAKHAESPETFTPYHIISSCVSNMVAGSDTTGSSLSAVFYYLLKNPEMFQKLRREVDAHKPTGKNSRYISFKDSQDMPYLQAVIKEALRIFSAVGLPLERVVPEGGATICGRFFPEDTIVSINPWVIHYNTDIFGPDAAEFKPDRWLIDDQEKLAYLDRHFIAFGMGSRTCIGRHISYLEMSKLVPRLIRDFDFELYGDIKEPGTPWTYTNAWFLKPRNFMVKVGLRAR